MDRRFILTTDLSNLSIRVSLSLLHRELLPFHLKEVLYSFSLVYRIASIMPLALWGLY